MSSSSFVGLKNQGATCYLNSLIQTLFLTPEFRMELFSLTESEVGLNLNKRKRVIVELQKLFARLQSPDLIGSYCPSFALSTKSLTNSFGWNAAQVMDQHDINELYNLLLDGIERQMPHNKKILNKYYKGRIINVIECTQCHYASKREEDFAQLNVILQNMNASFDDLQESLVSMYLDNEEELKNENAYFCPNCNDKVRAKKYCRLIQLPSIMVCNFNRFYYDLESGGRAKIDKKFKFPKSLDCSMFVEHEYSQMAKDVLCEYDLIAVVVHRGEGANAGHYHAFIRDMNDEVDWTAIQRNKKKRSGRRRRRRNNTNNKKTKNRYDDKEETKREKKDEATAILQAILTEHELLTKNRLQNEFKNMTNLDGWYTYQQLGLGSFAQFVRNNHRFKIINGDKRSFSVCLAHNNSNNLNGFIVCDGDDGTDEEYMPQQNTNNKPQTEQEEHKCNDANAAHWFDFNDEDITAVFDTEIDDLYDGGDAECPYMVIYRRKCMNTGNWPPQIPIYVSSLLIDEPLDAEEDEQQIDIAILKLSEEEDVDISMLNISSKCAAHDVIIISDDDDEEETEANLVCVSPPINKEEALARPNKKRKYEAFAAENDTKPNAEPKKKKRKVSAPSNHDQSSLANLPHPNGKRKKRKAKATQQVESEYLEGIRMKKGATVSELYSRVSEWSGIAANDLLIAQIVCKGRSRLRNAKVEDLGTCDKETKLRLVPMESDILIWDSSKYGTELAAKELQRRKKCIALNVYILSRASPCIIYVNPNNDRLRDVWSMIRSQLSGDERELMKDGNGRFRDVDTHSLFGAEDEMKFVSCLRIDAASVLRFEAPNAPSADEFVIRYRLKTGKVSAKECDEKEAYIAESECIETLFAMMCSAFDVDSTQFDLRKARSDWAVNRIIEVDKRLIKDCKFDHTQRLILAQKNCNKNMRSIQIYCETDVDAFKLGAAAKDEAHDGLDIYECNSVVLCSLDVDRRSTGLEIKRAIIEECDMKMDPCRLRISIVTQNGSRTKWHILNSNKQIGGHSGKCCVELSSCDDTEYGNKASGKALIFVHEKMASDGDDECAHYGPRHEIQITQTQREKRDALKAKIMQELGIEKDEKITIANRNIATHEWTILKQKIIKPRLYDRDIVAVAMHPIDTSKQFETKYDRHCQTQIKEKDNSDAEQDEPVMRINFVNDEENNDKLD
eukprot:446645_1